MYKRRISCGNMNLEEYRRILDTSKSFKTQETEHRTLMQKENCPDPKSFSAFYGPRCPS